ncbi:glycosyltransferase family 2 protein [Aequorivita lipolytica]|uniref:Glycosyltransferase family 2 protein n=1 Tax=Aequorivita lipolytica TaxID=153267 RepID=A0A5C6YN61_9FLAO|nr:glycosyltransferase family A protein [Aequorivita lipolytica]TXD69012.1 glycosyltransferase family 2 protein [Aequorivita lipolytica]SRX52949.1 Undecaprenyl-phosphate 4-deoxy-4-formamido-L-arabinose transferase [Aequorivita lipolytica]
MISILIPTYNYNVFSLVKNLHEQCESATIVYEILVLDDASTDKKIVEKNLKINSLGNCSFQVLDKNIGRSKIRNLLAEKAKYDWLLFLDADTFPSNTEFIANYVASFSEESSVIFGGIEYPKNNAENFSLRHKYGTERESLPLSVRLKNPYRSFITMGFAIKKKAFEKIKFNENLAGYGYEDSVFGYELQKNNIPLLHIDNPVIHLNLETNAEFIKKSQLALQNLLNFYETGAIDGETVKILKTYLKLKKRNLLFGVRWFFNISKKKLHKNLNSPKPSLLLFDLYRLGYLSSLKAKDA